VNIRCACAVFVVLAGWASSAAAQSVSVYAVQGGTLGVTITMGPVITGAPYSGEGTTTTSQTLSDGTRIERTATVKVYRDSAGRERREQTIVGLGALNPSGESEIVTIVDPVAGLTYTLDPKTHVAREVRVDIAPGSGANSRTRVMILRNDRVVVNGSSSSSAAGAPPPPPPPPPPPAQAQSFATARGGDVRPGNVSVQSLGTKQIDGMTVAGTMTTNTIATGAIGNDRPIEITDEQWTSIELKVLVLSRHHDPQTGDVEYRLTNIVRAEPAADLFSVPTDYTVVSTPVPPPPPPAPRKPDR